MLRYAFDFKKEIDREYKKILLNDKYKFYFTSGFKELEYKIDTDTWKEMSFVSIDEKENILGLIRFNMQRYRWAVSNIGLLSFFKKPKILFKDIQSSFDAVFKEGVKKINFSAVKGTQNEKLYDHFIEKYGGRKIGYYANEAVVNGVFWDEVYYEILFEEYKKQGVK